ncbi:hypothetical protein [Thetidibacter halocola]|uniref:Uncharacterized protein n=1 Tax=Thetidibacter halocola TaxID=2827239 RepID=A0A8J7WEZ6_9RHOB|nr:hypothetical protein [Thetidibacter halocola]MBS0124166.1 hypothetical protein [Thetidibacter halocola]
MADDLAEGLDDKRTASSRIQGRTGRWRLAMMTGLLLENHVRHPARRPGTAVLSITTTRAAAKSAQST